MSPAAPEPDPHPNVHGFAEVSELGQFKQFIYDNYHETHGIFGNEAESAWERRFRGHVPVMRQLLPANKTGPVLDFGCGDGLLLAVAQSLGYDDLTGGRHIRRLAQKSRSAHLCQAAPCRWFGTSESQPKRRFRSHHRTKPSSPLIYWSI
jgi:hypothetical protein